MVDWGIGPEAQVRAATAQTHPFSRDPSSELDLQFVPEAYAGLGRRITDARRNRLRVLRKLPRAFQDLGKFLLAQRHLKLPGGPGLRPMFCSFLVRLPTCPDVGLPGKLACGFELAADGTTAHRVQEPGRRRTAVRLSDPFGSFGRRFRE